MLPDIPNFRDAGGHTTGEFVPGVVFRSSELDRAESAALAQLPGVGVTTVFDLRTASEVAMAGDHLAPTIALTLIDVMADGPTNGAAAVAAVFAHHLNRVTVDQLNDGLGDGHARGLMLDAYREFVTFDSAHVGYRRMLLDIASNRGASVVHCTAGKDRTGWGVAILQYLAGVHDDEIMRDYLASNERWAPTYELILDEFSAAGGDSESLADILWVRPEYLRAAIDEVESTYGSRPAYIRDGLGLDAESVRLLQQRLAGVSRQA